MLIFSPGSVLYKYVSGFLKDPVPLNFIMIIGFLYLQFFQSLLALMKSNDDGKKSSKGTKT